MLPETLLQSLIDPQFFLLPSRGEMLVLVKQALDGIHHRRMHLVNFLYSGMVCLSDCITNTAFVPSGCMHNVIVYVPNPACLPWQVLPQQITRGIFPGIACHE